MENLKEREYNQRPGESFEAWKYRLILGKKDGEVELSWTDICNTLGLNCGQEYIRKIAMGIYEYRNYLRQQHEDEELSDSELNSIGKAEAAEMRSRMTKMQMQDQKRMVNRDLREWARAEHLQETIAKAIQNLNTEKPLVVKKRHINKDAKNEGALLLSDWHVGMVTDNAVNKFNKVIFKQRIEKLMQDTIENAKRHDIKKLHVFSLGDLANGLIHVTTRINNEEDIVQQCITVAETLSEMLMEFSESFDVNFYWSRGNHERVSANKKESVCRESFSDLILWFLKARLANLDGITICENKMDDEIIITDICGQTCLAVHGHKDKPARSLQNLALLLKIFPDYIFMGHFHSNAERDIQGAEVIVNGSLCGTDDYAMSLRRTSIPSQKFMVFNSDGRLCTYNIRLDRK